ncbi:MAG TPA: hypothetical protein VG308_20700 [Stellaceae bacterium]|nr:hypothetical protein [Stellaceae bacterium]
MKLPTGSRLSIEQNPNWHDREFIDEQLGAFNAAFMADSRYDYFGLFVRDDDGTIRAGLAGHRYGGWLFVNLLWVHHRDAAQRHRRRFDRRGRTARDRVRLLLDLCRHVLVPRPRFLSEIRL